jgi:uncharacterized alkaline shock family protein YloU
MEPPSRGINEGNTSTNGYLMPVSASTPEEREAEMLTIAGFRIQDGGVGSLNGRAPKVAATSMRRARLIRGTNRSERTGMSEGNGGSQASPLKGDMGTTTISNAVVSQVAGIAAQEVEKVQMGGGATAAVGGFLQSVTGSVTGSSGGGGNFSKGVTVEVGEEETAIDLTMALEYGQSIPRITDAVRRNVINRVENLLGLRVTEVNIQVNDVQIPEERPMLEQQEQTEEMARRQEQQA